MARNSRNYPKNEEDTLRDTIQKLRTQLRRVRKENRELKSENATLLDAWAKTEAFLADITDGVPLEELMRYKKLPKRVLDSKNNKVKKSQEQEKEETRQKWANWRKENL